MTDSPSREAADSSGPRVTVWHVGRRGEVAGGMTQVINAYFEWPFGRVTLRLLPTRNGGMGPTAIILMCAAAVRMPFLGRRDRTVVAVHLSQGGSFIREGLLLRWAAVLGYATVAHLHGSAFVDFARKSPGLVTQTLRGVGVVVALSDRTISEVERLLPATTPALVPNAVSVGSPVYKERIVVFAGAITRRKGVDVLLTAWRQIDPASGWELHIAGPPVETELMGDVPHGVVWRGPLPHAELMSLLDRSAIAVLPSRDEAMPMFILEALARKNAVISTSVGGIPEVLADGAGLLVTPGDVAELAAAIRILINDAGSRSALASAGYARFDCRYAAHKVYPQVEELWLSGLEARRGRRPTRDE